MESGNEQTVGDFNPQVGTKLSWVQEGESVRGYIVAVLADKLIVKIHGRPGRFEIPKTQKTKAD